MTALSPDLSMLNETLQWDKLLSAVEGTDREIEALETACEAKGYLKCLYDAGLIGVFQRNQMAAQLGEVCAQRLARQHAAHSTLRFGSHRY